MCEDIEPVHWAGQQAVVALRVHMDASSAGQIREELLSVINGGATALIADMTATTSCDHAGADAVVGAFQRAVISGTDLQLVVTAGHVSRVFGLTGLDHLVPIYPSLEAATAASEPAAAPAGVARPGLGGSRSWGSTVGYGR
jgi:anti-sigma B factor antagonist